MVVSRFNNFFFPIFIISCIFLNDSASASNCGDWIRGKISSWTERLRAPNLRLSIQAEISPDSLNSAISTSSGRYVEGQPAKIRIEVDEIEPETTRIPTSPLVSVLKEHQIPYGRVEVTVRATGQTYYGYIQGTEAAPKHSYSPTGARKGRNMGRTLSWRRLFRN